MKAIIKRKSRKGEITELKSLHQKEVSEFKFQLKEALKALRAEKRSHENTLNTSHNFFKETYRTLNAEKITNSSFWGKLIKYESFMNAVLSMRILIDKKITNKT